MCGVRWGKYHLVREYPCADPDCADGSPLYICGAHARYLKDPDRPGHYAARIHYEHTERDRWSLFDLSNDLFESNDIAAAHPELVKRLDAAFEKWWGALKF